MELWCSRVVQAKAHGFPCLECKGPHVSITFFLTHLPPHFLMSHSLPPLLIHSYPSSLSPSLPPSLPLSLCGQLSGGCEHEHSRGSNPSRAIQQALQHREGEGSRLNRKRGREEMEGGGGGGREGGNEGGGTSEGGGEREGREKGGGYRGDRVRDS